MQRYDSLVTCLLALLFFLLARSPKIEACAQREDGSMLRETFCDVVFS